MAPVSNLWLNLCNRVGFNWNYLYDTTAHLTGFIITPKGIYYLLLLLILPVRHRRVLQEGVCLYGVSPKAKGNLSESNRAGHY